MQPQYLLCCLTSEVNHHQQDPFDLLGQKELSKENPDQCHFAASLPRKPHGRQKIKMEKHTFCNIKGNDRDRFSSFEKGNKNEEHILVPIRKHAITGGRAKDHPWEANVFVIVFLSMPLSFIAG